MSTYRYAAFLLLVVGFKAIQVSQLPAQDINTLRRLKGEFQQQMKQSEFREAAETARQIVEIADDSFSDRPDIVAEALYMQGMVLHQLGNYADAERAMTRQIENVEKLSPGKFKDESIAWASNNLAIVCHALGKYESAETRFREAARLFEKLNGSEDMAVGAALHNLGNLLRAEGRYLEAEYLQRRALAIREKKFGVSSAIVGGSCDDLGRTLRDQNRDEEAEKYFRRAERIFNETSPDTISLALCINNLGNLARRRKNFDEAETLHQRALKIWGRTLGEESQDYAWTLGYLARLELARGNTEAARKSAAECRQILAKLWGTDHPDLAVPALLDAEIAVQTGNLADAEKQVDELIRIRDTFQVSPLERANAYALRADLRSRLNVQEGALEDQKKALQFAEEQTQHSSGSDFARGEFHREFGDMFFTMFTWQVEQGDTEGAFLTLERWRGVVLRQQLQSSFGDELKDLPQSEAIRLRRARDAAEVRLAETKTALSNAAKSRAQSGEPSIKELSRLSEALREAQAQFLSVKTQILEANPRYRARRQRMEKTVSLEELRQYLTKHDAVYLTYLLGDSRSFVVIVEPQSDPRIEEIKVPATAASILKISEGPLTLRSCHTALWGTSNSGIVPRLKSPTSSLAELEGACSALAQVLLPESLRTSLQESKVKHLLISPDPTLSSLPWETLRLGEGSTGQYLLDLTTSVSYVPSATILFAIESAGLSTGGSEGKGSLSVGNPITSGEAGIRSTLGSAPALYAGLGGSFSNLTAAGAECDYIRQNLVKAGIPVIQLLRQNATESRVRSSIEGKSLIHFACHGFADDRLGNAFGALALTPGIAALSGSDDGLLTLSEISELDLEACQLAILSACETNAGPQQQGEGVWALSRGFIASGVRRVVATNWSIDDESAAGLVSYFVGGVAVDWKKGEPRGVASRLHAAKKWARNQDRWKHPYYWSPFLHVGPN